MEDNNLYTPTEPAVSAPAEAPKKPLGKLIGIIAGAAVAIAAVIAVICISAGNNYKTPLNKLKKFYNGGYADTSFDNICDEFMGGFASKELNEIRKAGRKSDYYKELLNMYSDSFKEVPKDMKEEYGKNFKTTYTIDEKVKMDKNDLDEIRDDFREIISYFRGITESCEEYYDGDWQEFADDYDFVSAKSAKKFAQLCDEFADKYENTLKITDGYTLTITTVFTGSELDEPEEYTEEYNVLKINGHWVEEDFFYSFLMIAMGTGM